MRRTRINKRTIVLVIFAALIAILLFWLAIRFIAGRGILDEQFGDTGGWGKDIEETIINLCDADYVSLDDIDTYLFVGTDGGGENMGENLQGDLADFLMLLVIDNTKEKYGFYTIDRNSMVEMEVTDETGDHTSYETQQICLSHWYGTNEEMRNDNTVTAVSALLGYLDIDNYYTINMDDIGKINDAIGGVMVDIDSDMTAIDPAFIKGQSVLLTGKQAEKFLRARYALDDASNASRMARQQQYMEKAYSLLISQFRENPEYVNDLYDQLRDCIQSDGGSREVSVAVNHMMQYENQGFIKFAGETKINDTIGDGVDHEEFYVDEESILAGLKRIIDFRIDE